MTMFLTDNRYGTGASGATLPEECFMAAAYAARWIDRGCRPADIVPDRQGFAYDRPEQRDALIEVLRGDEPHMLVPDLHIDRDVTSLVLCTDTFALYVRRAGGYIYVDAWLWAEGYGDGDIGCPVCHGAGSAQSDRPGVLGMEACGCTV